MSEEESDNHVTFRTYPLENDDHCKTLIKIEPEHMENMRITDGDIVRVTGKDSTIAFCFSLNQEELERTRLHDVRVEYLNQSHRETDYPKMILSSLVSRNACPSRRMRLVKIERMPDKNYKESIPEATTITLGTMEFAEKTMPNYKDNIDFSLLFGRLVKEKERISVPFLPDYARRIERKTSNERQPHPVNFTSLIISAEPKNTEFWLVTKNTKFEFQNVSLDEFRGKAPKPDALSLLKVIPLVKKLHLHDTNIVFSSVEVFENTMKVSWYTQQRIRLPDNVLSEPSKFNSINIRPDSPELTIEIKDDLGNTHLDGHSGGGGGGSFPDPTTNEIVSDYSGEYRFSSTLAADAREITIIVKEITWVKREIIRTRTQMARSDKISMRTSEPSLKVLKGPWEFKINV